MTDLKVGVKLKPRVGSTWEYTYSQVELLSSAEHLYRIYWWTKATTPGGSVRMETFIASSLEKWEPVPTFFRVGRKYVMKRTENITYEILDVYHVDNPTTKGDSLGASAKATNEEGKSFVIMLWTSDFNVMKEVE